MMGFFFWLNSVALIEDLPLKEEAYDSVKELRNDIEGGYQQVRFVRLKYRDDLNSHHLTTLGGGILSWWFSQCYQWHQESEQSSLRDLKFSDECLTRHEA